MPAGNDLITVWKKRHVAYLFDHFGNERLIYNAERYCSCWRITNKPRAWLQKAHRIISTSYINKLLYLH